MEDNYDFKYEQVKSLIPVPPASPVPTKYESIEEKSNENLFPAPPASPVPSSYESMEGKELIPVPPASPVPLTYVPVPPVPSSSSLASLANIPSLSLGGLKRGPDMDTDDLDDLYAFDTPSRDIESKKDSGNISPTDSAPKEKGPGTTPIRDWMPQLMSFTQEFQASGFITVALENLNNANHEGLIISEDSFSSLQARNNCEKSFKNKKSDKNSTPISPKNINPQIDRAIFDRMNSILGGMHILRHQSKNTESSEIPYGDFSRRLVAQTVPLETPQALLNILVSQLRKDESIAMDLAKGSKHLQELVDVNVIDDFQYQYKLEMEKIADEITEKLLLRCLIDILD